MRSIPLSLLAMFGTAFSATIERHEVAGNLRDPMELDIAPNGDLYVIEREGRLLRVRPATGGVFTIGQIEVTALRATDPDSGYAREDGGLGIALDPDFAQNQRLYIYYSHPVEMLNRLSRFELKDGALDLSSEMKILDVPTDRDKRVCHHGGAIQFGSDGLLYLSTGDNTNPFESDGHAPIDDRPDHAYGDAMRSAGNTNDLRGKILRIRLTENGYEIPDGNLFPVGAAKTRPEIYVMGCRNPFRTSIDPKTGTIYWGEVGPDAGEPSPKGPRGHDELNQAKKAGNFGWPFVIADNQPYPIYDFATKTIGPMTAPAAPINPGHRNTGLRELPPAQPALIYYPYAETPTFPALGSGGRNAMAGPVFYHEPEREWNLLGPEDDRTVLMYEWMRGKIWKVKLDENENLVGLETLAEGFVHPMDMEMAADGTVWLLEYGSDWWFSPNGRILRLRPESTNRPPTIAIERSTSNPMEFSIKEASDLDNDELTVTWWVTEGVTERNLGNHTTITITSGGATEVRAVADDGKGGVTVARFPLVEEQATRPLALELVGAPKSLGFGETIEFKIRGGKALTDPSGVVVRARYIPLKGHDSGSVTFSPEMSELLVARQCLACHQVDQASVGPRYTDVAMRYQENATAMAHLTDKLKSGGSGVWGEIPMPPQIAVTDAEAERMVRAILALADGMGETRGTLNGQLQLATPVDDAAPGGAWEITAEAPGFATARLRLPAK
jgi:cytochrome c